MSERFSREQEPQIKQMVVIQKMDKLLEEGKLTESGRRMVEDLSPGDIIKVFGTDISGNSVSRFARVSAFNRQPSKKDLVIEWTIELIKE